MSDSFLPPVIATLLADTKQYSAKMAEAQGQMDAFGNSATASSAKFQRFANKAADAVIGVGVAIAAYGVDRALKYTAALDAIANQTNATASEMAYLKTEILAVSNATATSATDIASAYLVVEQAGKRGAAATELVSNAAKAAVITGTNVVDVTKTLIGVQNLQLAKGQSVAQITDLLVKANKDHIGTLDSLTSLLGGKVGAAFSLYGGTLAQATAMGDVFSRSNFTMQRQIASLVQQMGTLEAPLTKMTTKTHTLHSTVKEYATINGVLETRLKHVATTITESVPTATTFAKALANVGLNAATLAKDARSPGGLLAVLTDIKNQARSSGTPVSEYLNAVFGKSSAVAANVLITHLTELKNLTTSFSTASGAGLNKSFDLAQQQLPYKLKAVETTIQNAFTGIGLTLLPAITDVANWATDAASYLEKHPLVSRIASDAAIGVFTAAVGYRLYSAVSKVMGIFKTSETVANTGATVTLTDVLAANTAAVEANTVALGGKAVGTPATDITSTLAKGGFLATLLAKYGMKILPGLEAAGTGAAIWAAQQVPVEGQGDTQAKIGGAKQFAAMLAYAGYSKQQIAHLTSMGLDKNSVLDMSKGSPDFGQLTATLTGATRYFQINDTPRGTISETTTGRHHKVTVRVK